ncbi:hypothetical protein VP01_5215g1 [Puccinia sorghi]|uniref:Uncharacterized protein n=1 Tax=Puccinia sorghi TaxID=27349 RepID=A0A0L6UKN1_9BASI|nr:hypothetical protein VP01_5215g1 [Puccinia sorghi]
MATNFGSVINISGENWLLLWMTVPLQGGSYLWATKSVRSQHVTTHFTNSTQVHTTSNSIPNEFKIKKSLLKLFTPYLNLSFLHFSFFFFFFFFSFSLFFLTLHISNFLFLSGEISSILPQSIRCQSSLSLIHFCHSKCLFPFFHNSFFLSLFTNNIVELTNQTLKIDFEYSGGAQKRLKWRYSRTVSFLTSPLSCPISSLYLSFILNQHHSLIYSLHSLRLLVSFFYLLIISFNIVYFLVLKPVFDHKNFYTTISIYFDSCNMTYQSMIRLRIPSYPQSPSQTTLKFQPEQKIWTLTPEGEQRTQDKESRIPPDTQPSNFPTHWINHFSPL